MISGYNDSVLRYDATKGKFIDIFASGGGLDDPEGLAFGPDGHLYDTSRSNAVLRYDGTTGAFIDIFASGGGLEDPAGLVFGPDGCSRAPLSSAAGTTDRPGQDLEEGPAAGAPVAEGDTVRGDARGGRASEREVSGLVREEGVSGRRQADRRGLGADGNGLRVSERTLEAFGGART